MENKHPEGFDSKMYSNMFCRDLGLCVENSGEYWGVENANILMVCQVAKYLAAHQHVFNNMGLGMLISFVCASVNTVIYNRVLSDTEDASLRVAIMIAMKARELYPYVTYFYDDNDPADPLLVWIRERFPEWKPGPWPNID